MIIKKKILYFILEFISILNCFYSINSNSNSNNFFSYESKHSSITKEYLEDLKKHVSFEVFDYENHPFKNQEFSEISKKLKILDIPMEEIQRDYLGKKENEPKTETENENENENENEIYKLSQSKNLNNNQKENFNDSSFPLNFDPFIKWPKCIHPIENQLQCGSCWAFTTSDVLSDRLCIASNNRINVQLSVQDPISCSTSNLACNGGYLNRAISYLITNGAVTSKCLPYTAGYGIVEKCQNTCKSSVDIYRKYRASSFRKIQYASDIKFELLNYGPVATGYLVYQDFMSYKSGIYKRTSDYLLGGHAVRVIGWGTDGTTEYWVVANSWGKFWGENGFFRIAMNHCCNFEFNVLAPYARLTYEDLDLDLDLNEKNIETKNLAKKQSNLA
jgi:cathepsin B